MSKRKASESMSSSPITALGNQLDAADASEFMVPERRVQFDVDLRGQTNLVRIDAALMKKLRTAATADGVSAKALVNLWLGERAQAQHR